MRTPRHWVSNTENREDAQRQTATLAGIAVVLLLLIAGLFLVHTLRATVRVEDCLMAGRLDCDRLVAPRR
jgi:hypothetical protein